MSAPRFSARRVSRAFSLIELLAVVTISAVLAIVGMSLFRKHVIASRGAEAYSIIQAARAAEEGYLAENHVYLNVSTDNGGKSWYPKLAPDKSRSAWSNSGHADFAAWQQLAPAVNRSVLFGYLVNAGPPGTAMPALQVKNGPDLSAAQPLDWYLIQAKGDTDGNGVAALYATTSLTSEVYVENEGE